MRATVRSEMKNWMAHSVLFTIWWVVRVDVHGLLFTAYTHYDVIPHTTSLPRALRPITA